jgi:hypothetical protein
MDGRFGDDSAAKAESLQQIKQVIETLFKPDDIICFFALGHGDENTNTYRWVTPNEPLEDIHDGLCELNDSGHCIYFGGNPRARVYGTKSADVEVANAFFLDVDGTRTEQQFRELITTAGLPEPSIVWFSGGGWWAAWMSDESVDVPTWVGIQKGIAQVVAGADSTIADAAQLCRAPGFRNRKPAYGPDFPMSVIASMNDGTHDHTTLPTAGTYTPAVDANGEPEQLNIEVPQGMVPRFVDEFLNDGKLLPPKGKEQPSRRGTAFQVAIEMKAAGIPQDEAAERIGKVLLQLGLDDHIVDEFMERQVGNAYSQPRTPTIDKDRLPKTIPSKPKTRPEFTITDAGNGKVRCLCRRGAATHLDVVDPVKARSRDRFLADVVKALGEDTDTSELDASLKAVACGDRAPDAPPEQPTAPPREFIRVDALIRPERFAITVGDEHVSGTTVEKFEKGEREADGVWLTLISRNGAQREAVELPMSVDVGGQVFHVHPAIGPPAVSNRYVWSDASQDEWLATGADRMQPVELFNSTVSIIDRFVDFPSEDNGNTPMLLALWALLTYTPAVFTTVPFLVVNGPKGSGKSRVMDCLELLAFRASVVANPSAASLFRELHINATTFLIDEAENLEQAGADSGLMPTLLHSNRRGATVPRCDGDDHTVKHFSIFAPKAFFSIKEPHDPLADRSIRIPMLRSPKGSPKALLSPKNIPKFGPQWQALRDGWNVFVLNHGHQLVDLADPESITPTDMFPRSREVWGPILQLAELLERLGVAGLLTRMQAFALEKSAVAEAITFDPVDEFILRAFVQLRAEGKAAVTSTAVLAAAYKNGLDPSTRLSEKATGAILRRYRIQHGTGRRRREWVTTDHHLVSVDEAYGIGLFSNDDKNTVGHPPGKCVTSVTSVTDPGADAVKPGKTEDSSDGRCVTSVTKCVTAGGKSVTDGDSCHKPAGDTSDPSGDTSVTHSGDTSAKSVTPKTPENKALTATGDTCDTCDTFSRGVPGGTSVCGEVTL